MSFLCSVPILSALIAACLPPLPLATGYVEGEYILLAPVEVAQVDRVTVRRGTAISAGQALVFLEKRDAEIAVAQAVAALVQAESNLANISLGRRPEEIAVIEAALASARAQSFEAGREQQRELDLFQRGISPKAKYDQIETQAKVAQSKVVELEANLRVATLPARADEIKAAQAAVDQARAAEEQAGWRLSKRTLSAVSAGTVTDVLRSAGEVAGPQAPVLSILPRGAIKLRLYIPEVAIAGISIGTPLDVSCDGCPPNILARVSYIAPGPEFTPPVIYSLENRQKLVFLVEARLADDQTDLKPGQIVHVDLGDPGDPDQ